MKLIFGTTNKRKKQKSNIMIDKGRKVTIIINGVRIFDVKRELVKEFPHYINI